MADEALLAETRAIGSHATTREIMKYEIWLDNGVSTIFEYLSDDLSDVLDAFCKEAGYIDQAHYVSQFNLTDSPFNIKSITDES